MKILHVCLANFYIDNYSYQENMLSKAHKDLGYDVEIIASLVSYDENGKPCLLKKSGRYINEYEIPVTRLDYKNRFYAKKLRLYKKFYETMEKAQPDIIFIHGCQFMDIKYVRKYVRKNPQVKVYVDNHADFINSGKGFLSKYILHKVIWRYYANFIEPCTTKFYGVLPARVEFLKDVYKLPKNKIELLVMGADDKKVNEALDEENKKITRKKYDLKENDFIIMTGGKFNSQKKQIILLMKAVKRIKEDNVKLIIFGSITEDIKDEMNELIDNRNIIYIGWKTPSQAYKLFAISDLVIFPGTHSVFWEQVVAIGIPLIVRYWEGMTHIDLGGNCRFLYNDSIEEIKENIECLINSKETYCIMLQQAQSKKSKEFLYSNIAKRSLVK